MKLVLLASAILASVEAIDNGKGYLPPMGWRSWNLFGANVNQQVIMAQMAGIADRSRTVNGQTMSLSDLGYIDVGLDDNWQACGSYGPNKYSFHNADGMPLVNYQRFPDFKAMTDYAHSLGLTSGWYGNNCICSDHCSDPSCYMGDVDAVVAYGFDSIKLDGCGAQRDLQQYADLFNATGKSILIENCHWGGTVPNATWCPWNFFRTSGDIRASYASIVGNLQTTIQWAQTGLSAPGCYGYPDMLEVGCAHGPGGPSDPGLSFTEARSHFNAWCIVSSPLTLSHDLTNATVMDAVWPIITNTEALGVSQAWAGFSGGPFASAPTSLSLKYTLSKEVAWRKPEEAGDYVVEGVPSYQFFYKPVNATATAVLLMNHDTMAQDLVLNFSAVPKLPCASAAACNLRDLNAHADLGAFTGTYTAKGVASHDSVFLMLK